MLIIFLREVHMPENVSYVVHNTYDFPSARFLCEKAPHPARAAARHVARTRHKPAKNSGDDATVTVRTSKICSGEGLS